MASTQQKSERAEAAAKQAAKDLEQVNREKEFVTTTTDPNQKRGVIGSVLSAVRDTYENAKEAVVGKRDPTTAPDPVEVTRVVDDVDVARTGEVRDISAGKSSGIYDSTKDATVDKMGEEGTGKLAELRDSAAEAAKKAMGYLGGKKEEAKEKTADTTEWAKQKASEMTQATKDKASEATECAKQKTSEMAETTKDKASDATESAKQKASELAAATKDKAADTTETAKQRTSEMTKDTTERPKQRAEAAKQKTAEAKDKTKENLSAAEEQTTRRKMEELRVKHNKEQRGDELSIAEAVAVAEALKASDQTFNDVGSLGDEAQAHVASATATFVMMFSSSLSVVEFYLLKRFPMPYALYLTSVSVLAGLWGQFFARRIITCLGRASIIVFILSGVIFASAHTMGVVGIEKSIQMINNHEFMGFLGFCTSQ